MFKHENVPQCRYIGKCYKALCPFKHNQKEGQSICEKRDSSVEGHDKILTEDLVNEKTDDKIEDEEVFNLYVRENFPRLFDYDLKNNRYVPCYFCDFCSKSQNLKTIEEELTKHIGTKHKEITDKFDPVDSEYEDWIHEEFLQFFAQNNPLNKGPFIFKTCVAALNFYLYLLHI